VLVGLKNKNKKNKKIMMNNDDNSNNRDNVYGAVIMTEVNARVHPVHLMNVD